ncbi:uncharacterized protein LOC143366086 isoform X1 [Andrena cerasifolii]|uniref:uncharacterized protein LOC143366086 isoform X1 n=1 Tax=Andrena cerasifolii TaxID=2819439 RepID=UPI004037AACB
MPRCLRAAEGPGARCLSDQTGTARVRYTRFEWHWTLGWGAQLTLPDRRKWSCSSAEASSTPLRAARAPAAPPSHLHHLREDRRSAERSLLAAQSAPRSSSLRDTRGPHHWLPARSVMVPVSSTVIPLSVYKMEYNLGFISKDKKTQSSFKPEGGVKLITIKKSQEKKT